MSIPFPTLGMGAPQPAAPNRKLMDFTGGGDMGGEDTGTAPPTAAPAAVQAPSAPSSVFTGGGGMDGESPYGAKPAPAASTTGHAHDGNIYGAANANGSAPVIGTYGTSGYSPSPYNIGTLSAPASQGQSAPNLANLAPQDGQTASSKAVWTTGPDGDHWVDPASIPKTGQGSAAFNTLGTDMTQAGTAAREAANPVQHTSAPVIPGPTKYELSQDPYMAGTVLNQTIKTTGEDNINRSYNNALSNLTAQNAANGQNATGYGQSSISELAQHRGDAQAAFENNQMLSDGMNNMQWLKDNQGLVAGQQAIDRYGALSAPTIAAAYLANSGAEQSQKFDAQMQPGRLDQQGLQTALSQENVNQAQVTTQEHQKNLDLINQNWSGIMQNAANGVALTSAQQSSALQIAQYFAAHPDQAVALGMAPNVVNAIGQAASSPGFTDWLASNAKWIWGGISAAGGAIASAATTAAPVIMDYAPLALLG